MTSVQKFIEIGRGEPLRRVLNARGVAKYSEVGHVAARGQGAPGQMTWLKGFRPGCRPGFRPGCHFFF